MKQTFKGTRSGEIDLLNLPDLLNTIEVAAIFRVAPLTVKRWGNAKAIKFIKINSRGDRRYKRQVILDRLKGILSEG